MSVSVNDRRLLEIVAADAARETVSEEFGFTEGPIWHPRERHLTFSDIPGDRIYRFSDAQGVSVYREPSNMANGNTYDREGRILTCEHATSRVSRDDGGVVEVVASHYDGKELNSPNDIVVGGDGAVFFTDPAFGRSGMHGVEREPELDFQGVFRLDPSSLELTAMRRDFATPNGLCFGRTEDVMFVADTMRRHIRRFAVTDAGLEGGEVFAESPAPDGLKIDSAGHLYAGGPGGVHVYDGDDGTFLGVLETPSFCANFTWGDDDLRTLYMTSSTGLYRLRVEVPGVALL